MNRNEILRRREEAAQVLAEARAALPAHSIRPHQLQRVEEAEDRLEELDKLLAETKGHDKSQP